MRRRCHLVLDAAYDAGVRYVDAARSYGLAEEFLASWLNERRPAGLTVGSKWGYRYVGRWRMDVPVHEVKDHSVGMLRRQIAESRALLGDRLNLYQVHSAKLESGVLEDREVLDELRALSGEGLVAGLSVSGPRQGEVIRRALALGEGPPANPFACVQATWNVLEPSAGPALAQAHARGWGVIVKEALANGRLTARGADPERRVLEDVARDHQVSADAVALAAVLVNPWVDVVLSGAVTVEELTANLSAGRVSLSDRDQETLGTLAGPPQAYWEARGRLAWS